MLSYAERAAEVMRHLCEHDGQGGHGYTWGARWGDGTTEELTLSDGTVVRVAGGDRDCSSGVISAYEAAGVDCGGATYTGDMRRCMTSTGNFEWHTSVPVAQVGDVLLNEAHHTAMMLDATTLAQFSIAENGTVYGKQGDQTGRESNIRGYYDYPWDGVLRCVAGTPPQEEDEMQLTDLIHGWNGDVNVADRMAGTDYAANVAREQLTRTDDITGRGTAATMYERVCYLGQKTDQLKAGQAELAAKLDAVLAALGK